MEGGKASAGAARESVRVCVRVLFVVRLALGFLSAASGPADLHADRARSVQGRLGRLQLLLQRRHRGVEFANTLVFGFVDRVLVSLQSACSPSSITDSVIRLARSRTHPRVHTPRVPLRMRCACGLEHFLHVTAQCSARCTARCSAQCSARPQALSPSLRGDRAGPPGTRVLGVGDRAL